MFNFHHPVEIKFGEGIISQINEVAEAKDYSRIIVVSSNSQMKNGTTEFINTQLGERVKATVSDIEPNPTLQNVGTIVDAMNQHNAHAVVAVGGGSAMDASKAAAAAYMQGVAMEDLLEHDDFTRALPVIAIPTTSGSASEVTAASIISDKEKELKVPLIGPALYPQTAVVDPELTLTCPPGVTAVSGIDILCHALDCLGSVKHNPVSDALAIRASKLAFENLLAAYTEPSNREARNNLSLASMLAGMAFSQTGTSGSHATSYYLTSHYGVPHGEACAFTMDAWFVINAEANPELQQHARDIGFDDAEALSEAFNALKREMGLAMTFEDLGISREDIPQIAEESMQPANMKNNIAQLSKDEIIGMLEKK
ncbi:iron-containing alcohol dehydrogenase [Salinicoccus roseus]|uniref:iron-containing alcohol dehydrogenase n=1 Tax=Salinicoccus roseus TaxID=45670 RepID=UPI00230107D2|nr:iron-containing alcohol dehydrogenase [Salinicoccus roseus]